MPTRHLNVTTRQRREIIDLTDEVLAALTALGAGDGLVCISVGHCTCAIYVNENESGLVADTLRLLDRLAADGHWQHDRIDDNARAHLAASLMGNSVVLPVVDGRLELGTWQRVMLVELDGPRRREVAVTLIRGSGE